MLFKGKYVLLVMLVVCYLFKELKIDINDIYGLGKDGRVFKEDIYKFVKEWDFGVSI